MIYHGALALVFLAIIEWILFIEMMIFGFEMVHLMILPIGVTGMYLTYYKMYLPKGERT